MAGGVHGGRYCVVDGIPAVRNWAINDNGSLAQFVNSATRIGHGRRPGITSWNGQYGAHGAVPLVLPGDLFAFEGFTAPDTDIVGGSGEVYSGNAMCSSCVINWDWAGGPVLDHQVTFEGHLALTNTFAVTPEDTTIADPEAVGPTKIEYSTLGGSSWVELANLTNASLQLTNAVQGYVNSSTASKTGRKAGPFDWSATIGIQDTLLGGGLLKQNAYQFRFYINATQYYLLKWGRVQEFTGLQAVRETGAIIAHSITIAMSGTEDISSTPTLGTVTLPDSTEFWPVDGR